MRRYNTNNSLEDDFSINLSRSSRRLFRPPTQHEAQVNVPVSLPPKEITSKPTKPLPFNTLEKTEQRISLTKPLPSLAISAPSEKRRPPPSSTSTSPPPPGITLPPPPVFTSQEKEILLKSEPGFEDIYVEFDSKYRIRTGSDERILRNENIYFSFRLTQNKSNIISNAGGLSIGYPLEQVIEMEIGSIVVPNFLSKIEESYIYKRVYLVIEEFSDRQVVETSTSSSWADKHFVFNIKPFYTFDPIEKKDVIDNGYLFLEPVKDKLTFKRPVDKVDNFTFVFILGEQPVKFESDFMVGDISLGPTTRVGVSLPKEHKLVKGDIVQVMDSRTENYMFALYPELKAYTVIDPVDPNISFVIDPITIDSYKRRLLSETTNFTISNTPDEYNFNIYAYNRHHVIFEDDEDLNHNKTLDRINNLVQEIDEIHINNVTAKNEIESKLVEFNLNTNLIDQNTTALIDTTNELHGIKNGFTITYNISFDWENNKFLIDNLPITDPLILYKGNAYFFLQIHESNLGNDLRFSTTPDGIHGGGTEYTNNITVEGVPSFSNSKITVIADNTMPVNLYGYSLASSGMGFNIEIKDALITSLHNKMLTVPDTDYNGHNYSHYDALIRNLELSLIPALEEQIENITTQITIKENEKSSQLDTLIVRKRERAFAKLSLDQMLYYRNETDEKILSLENKLFLTQFQRYNKINTNASLTSSLTNEVYGLVTVQSGKYQINPKCNSLYRGNTYRFIQEDSSNTGRLLRFAESSDNSGNNEWITDVSFNGVPGSVGAYTSINVTSSTPSVLYYYDSSTPNMGGMLNISLSYEDNLVQEINNAETEKNNLNSTITDNQTQINTITSYITNITNAYNFKIVLQNSKISINYKEKPILYLVRGFTYTFELDSNTNPSIIFKDIGNNIYNTNITPYPGYIEFVVDSFTISELKYEENGISNSGNSIFILDQESLHGQLWLSHFFQFYYSTYLSLLTQYESDRNHQIELNRWIMRDNNNTFLWSEQIDDGAGNINTTKLASSIQPGSYTIYELLNYIEYVMNNDTNLGYKYSINYNRYNNSRLEITLLNGNGESGSGFRIDFSQNKLFESVFTVFNNAFQNALTNDFSSYIPNSGYNGHYENNNHIIKRPFQVGDYYSAPLLSLKEIICVIETNTGNTQQRINIICREYDPTTNGYSQISKNNSIILPGVDTARRIYLSKLNFTAGDTEQYFLIAYTHSNTTYYNLCSINVYTFAINTSIETRTDSNASRYYLSRDLDLWHEGMDLRDADGIETYHYVIFFRKWLDSTIYKFQYVSLVIDPNASPGSRITPGDNGIEYLTFASHGATDINNVNGCLQMSEQTQLLFSIQFWNTVSSIISNMFQLVEYHSLAATNKLQIVLTKIEDGYSAFNSNNAFFSINKNMFVWIGRNFQIRNVSDTTNNKLIAIKLYNIHPSNITTEFESASLLDYSKGTEHMLDTSSGYYLGNNLFIIMQGHYETSTKFIKQILFEINPISFEIKTKQTFEKAFTDQKEAYYLLGYSNNHADYYTHPFTLYYYPEYNLYQWMVHHRYDADHNNVIRTVIIDQLINEENDFSFNLDKRLLGEVPTYNITNPFSVQHVANNSIWDVLNINLQKDEIEKTQNDLHTINYQINQLNYFDNTIKYHQNIISSVEQHIKSLEQKKKQLETNKIANEHKYNNMLLEINLLKDEENLINGSILLLNGKVVEYNQKIGIIDPITSEYVTGYGYAFRALDDEVKVLEGGLASSGSNSTLLQGLYSDLSNVKNRYNLSVSELSSYKSSLNNLLLIISLDDASSSKVDAETLLTYNLQIDELARRKNDTANILEDLNNANYLLNQDITNLQYNMNTADSVVSYKTDALQDLLKFKYSEAIDKWVTGGENDNAINRMYLQNIMLPEVPFIVTKRRFSIFMRLRVLVVDGNTNFISL